ncbi:serine acetyltransferase [Candidatus Sumerlaeota bacterium]|nr:serine acetyltransferase [Candidatus Sumerlaeota bacterium]
MPKKTVKSRKSPPARRDSQARKVAARLISTYSKPLPINHLRCSELPSRDKTVAVLNQIKDLLFAAHRLMGRIRQGDMEYQIGGLLESIELELERQIFLARSYTKHNGDDAARIQERSRLDTLAFLERLPELREILSDDVKAAYEGDPAASGYDEIIFCYPGFEAVSTYRIAHELYALGVPLLPRIMAEHAHSLTGCDIHPGAKIGRSFFIDHATGVVIGATAVIGDRVKLYQGVTLGALSFHLDDEGNLIRTTKRHPTLEDDVVIYAGATVLGGATIIGKGSVIGGSCWITRSVPPHSKVIISPPQRRVQGGKPPLAAKQESPSAAKHGAKDVDWSI